MQGLRAGWDVGRVTGSRLPGAADEQGRNGGSQLSPLSARLWPHGLTVYHQSGSGARP